MAKDPIAPAPKRGKKGAKAEAAAPKTEPVEEDPNAQLTDEGHNSISGKGIKNEDRDDEDHLQAAQVANYKAEKAAEDQLYDGLNTN